MALRKPTPDCLDCHGTGWRILREGGVESAQRCPCRLSVAERGAQDDLAELEELAATMEGHDG